MKQIFAEMSVVYGSTNVSYDTVRKWKKKNNKFEFGLKSIVNTPKSGRPMYVYCDAIVSKVKKKKNIERAARYTVCDKARMTVISPSRVH